MNDISNLVAQTTTPSINLKPDRRLSLVVQIIILVSACMFFGIGGFLAGRGSKTCSISSEGKAVEQNTFLGGSVCNVLERTKLYILTGFWEPEAEEIDVDFSLYKEVWYMLQENYVDSGLIDGEEMMYGSIKGLISSVGDPYTVFLDPTETEQFDEMNEGLYQGIGAELGYKDSAVVVVTPLEGSPAKEAGLLPGDVIAAVDGVSVDGKNIYEVIDMIRGDKGTKVVLSVYRDQTNLDIEITRDEITNPPIYYKGTTDGIAVVNINRFTDTSSAMWNSQWSEVVDQIVADGATSVIFDVRGNPGGYLDSVLYALQDLLPKGTIMMKTEDRYGEIDVSKVTREGKLLNVKVVVLVNGGSASAAEIFAGSLQKNDRAVIVGTDSFGKGSVQNVETFVDGSSIHITIEKWLLPDGQNLDENNKVVPDVVLEFDDELYKTGTDNQLEKAKEELN